MEHADDEAEWDRHFAKTEFNAAWDLIDRTDRSEDEELAMLLAAAASCRHWSRIGGPEEWATADWQVAHVASLLGLGDLAQRFASRNLATVDGQRWDGWRLASAHEGMARACAAAGDAEGRRRHIERAQAALEREPDAEDRDVVAGQLATVPSL